MLHVESAATVNTHACTQTSTHSHMQVGLTRYTHISSYVQIRALNSANVLITDSPAEMGVAMKEAMKNAGKL